MNPVLKKIFEFCELELGIVDARQTMKIDRAHRIGTPNSDKTRPIVAKFNFFQDKERIKRAAAEKLTNSKFNVGDQFPKEIQQRRRRLVPILKKAQSEGKTAVLVYDKLYINGVKYEEGSDSKVRPGDRRERERRISDSERNNQQRTLRSPGVVNLRQDQHNVVRGAQVSNSFSVLADSADVDNAYNSENSTYASVLATASESTTSESAMDVTVTSEQSETPVTAGVLLSEASGGKTAAMNAAVLQRDCVKTDTGVRSKTSVGCKSGGDSINPDMGARPKTTVGSKSDVTA